MLRNRGSTQYNANFVRYTHCIVQISTNKLYQRLYLIK